MSIGGVKPIKVEIKILVFRSKAIKTEKIIPDPANGIRKGFNYRNNLIRGISRFHSSGFSILLRLSEKRFIEDLFKTNDSK